MRVDGAVAAGPASPQLATLQNTSPASPRTAFARLKTLPEANAGAALPALHPQPSAPVPNAMAPAPPQPRFWTTPITTCVRAAWWGLTTCFEWSLSAAQMLGTLARSIADMALALWPHTPAQAAQAGAGAPSATDMATQRQCAVHTLELLQGAPQGDVPPLSQEERATLLRAYYPVAKLIYTLRHDASLVAVRQRHAMHVAVPDALLGLQREALGLAEPTRPEAPSSWSLAASSLALKQRLLARLQQDDVHVIARTPLQWPSVEGVHAWLTAAQVPASSLQMARRLAGGDALLAIDANAFKQSRPAAQSAVAAFVPGQPFDPINAADERAQALRHWIEHTPAYSALALLEAACAMVAGPEPLLFDVLDAATAQHVVEALASHGHLRLATTLTALLAPGAWPAVRCNLDALGFDAEDTQQAWAQASQWAELTPKYRTFVVRDILGPGQLWCSWPHRLAFATLLHQPIDATAWFDVMRRAESLGGGHVACMAAQAMRLVVDENLSSIEQARHCLLQGADEGLYSVHMLRQAACSAGLHDARVAAPLAQRVLYDEATCDADIIALAQAWVWDPDAAAHADSLLTQLGARSGPHLLALNALERGATQASASAVLPGDLATLTDSVVVAGIRIDVAAPHAAFGEPPVTHITLPQETTLAICFRQGRSVLLEGPAGCGKTQMVSAMASRLGLVLHRLTLSPETDEQDLLGRYMPNSSGTPVWSDGLLVRAMRQGHIVLLDEANLSPPGLLERLNSVFDSRRLFVETTGEHLVAHANFRCVLASNPARYAGRSKFGEALRSRLRIIHCPPLSGEVLRQMLARLAAGRLPDDVVHKLVEAHLAVLQQASRHAASSAAESITPRAVVRVAMRVIKLQAARQPDQSVQSLVAREFEEVYADLLRQSWRDMASAAREIIGWPQQIDLSEGLVVDATHMQLGDVRWPKASIAPPASDLILTPRTRLVLYRLLKAIVCAEPVALIGRRAGGKTALVGYAASLLGRPFVQQVMSAGSDVGCLIGSYGPEGWRDGALLALSRPDKTPGVLLLDECNLAPSAVLERLNAVLDDARTLTLPERDGSAVRLHKDFRLVCAMNPPGPTNPGRLRLSSALCSRLTWIEVPEIGADEQDAIAVGVARQLGLQQAQVLCAALRRFVQTELHLVDREQVSLRELCAAVRTFADLLQQRPAHEAFKLALQAEYGGFVTNAAEAHWAQGAQRAWPEAGWPTQNRAA